MRSLVFFVGLSLSVVAAPAVAQDVPSAPDLLFEAQDWQRVGSDSTLLYRYERTGSLAADRVPGLSDTIRLHVRSGSAAASRNVEVEMFSGPRRRPAGPFDDVAGNPALVLFLEQHLQTLVAAVGANPRYLRNAIRAGLRESASVVPITATYEDRQVSAWRIETRPFLQDPRRNQMQGLESLTYSFVVSEQVPGKILSIVARADTADGRSLLQEALNYDPDGT